MRARSLHLIVSAALMLPVCAALSAGALAQAPAPAANPQLAAAQASFESLPEAERRAIQADLIWSGHFNGAVSGSYGPLTFRAINAFKAGKGAPDGLLTPAERRSLAQSAQAAREAAGFRVIADERTGLRIGIPAAVLPKRDVSPSGSRWQSADGKITLDTSATPPGRRWRPSTRRPPRRRRTIRAARSPTSCCGPISSSSPARRRPASSTAGSPRDRRGCAASRSATTRLWPLRSTSSSSRSRPASSRSRPAAAPGSGRRLGQRADSRIRHRGHGSLGSGRAADGATCDRHRPGRAPRRDGGGGYRRLPDAAGRGRLARLRGVPEAGLALLDIEGGAALAAPAARSEPPAEGEDLVLLAFGEEGGRRVPVALPGRIVAGAAGPAVLAPLQPGQAGAAAFDRQGRLAGLVTGNPSDRVLIAGVAPQRSHALAAAAAVQAAASRAGAPLVLAPAGSADRSTGAIVDARASAILPILCGL